MFLFSSNAAKVNPQSLRSVRSTFGEWNLQQHGAAILLWCDTKFTRCHKLRNTIVISLRRPADEEPICRIEWNSSSGKLAVSRRWSGEFTVYIGHKPDLVITSHLRLAALVCGGLPSGLRSLRPGYALRTNAITPRLNRPVRQVGFHAAYHTDYGETLKLVRRLVYESVKQLPDSAALLLSGGLDSSIIAAVARDLGKSLAAFVFSLKRPLKEQREQENDLLCARRVAAHLNIRCNEILLKPRDVIRNVPLAIFLSESPRGTIIDPCTALIEVAKRVSEAGFSRVLMGETADDLFGSFKFALRYKRGQGLRAHYRRELDAGTADELAMLQKVFEPWGIAVINPFWTAGLKAIGYNIPLSFRLDSKRLMKRILRDAFADLLPEEIIRRPKVITREGSQVRYALETEFGASRARYRPLFREIFSKGRAWPKNLPLPKN